VTEAAGLGGRVRAYAYSDTSEARIGFSQYLDAPSGFRPAGLGEHVFFLPVSFLHIYFTPDCIPCH